MESVITWRASVLNQTLHFFGIGASNDEGDWRARGMGDTDQICELASFTNSVVEMRRRKEGSGCLG